MTMEEKEVKKVVGEWLEEFGCKIFDELKRPLKDNWGSFELLPGDAKTPDLVVKAKVIQGGEEKEVFLAVELKNGNDEHQDVFLEGYDSVIQQYIDYCSGAKYIVNDKEIEISAFLLATQFSPKGYLWHREKETRVYNMGVFTAYPSTFTFGRVLFHQRRKIKECLRTLVELPEVKGNTPKIRANFSHIGILYAYPPKIEDVISILLSAEGYIWRIIKPGKEEDYLRGRITYLT